MRSLGGYANYNILRTNSGYHYYLTEHCFYKLTMYLLHVKFV